LRGIAATKNYEFCIPKTNYGDIWKDNHLFDIFELGNVENVGFLPAEFYPEKQFHYDSEYVENCPDNVNLHGYYQSEKYFKHIEESIRKDFKFKDYILEPCVNNFHFDEIIALHVRRSDYVSNSTNHPLCDISYYKKALTYFDSNIPVMIFSDDIRWCEYQPLFESDRFMISESNDGAVDLCLMSMCNYHIIANSSFSWWGAWLAKSKKVIAPSQWFGTEGNTAKNQTQDLYLDDWIKI
jgi:hypothetical protein